MEVKNSYTERVNKSMAYIIKSWSYEILRRKMLDSANQKILLKIIWNKTRKNSEVQK